MQEAFLDINGVPTLVTSEGRWVEAGLAADGHKDVVVVIPGNPGVPGFYHGFIKALNSKLPMETPVWLVGHAGHVCPNESSLRTLPNFETNRHLYDLEGQVKHKIEFIKKYVPEDARIHLVGHSIGSWFLLNILKDESIRSRVVKCYLLFPTIERMADSPNGTFFSRYVQPFIWLVVLAAWIFSYFPVVVQVFFIQIFGLINGIPRKYTTAVRQLINPAATKRALFLAKQEMALVRELDHDLISKNSDQLWLYYGTTDGWTPIEYYESIKAKHPTVKANLCQRNFAHSFVLRSDKEMGYLLGDVINETIL